MLSVLSLSSGMDRLREGNRAVDIRTENPASGKASIAELRREMSRQRDREIAELGHGTDARFGPPSEPAARDPYLEIRERRLAEERRYHQLPTEIDLHKRRKQWGDGNDTGPPNGLRPPNAQTTAPRWEDDELRLMQWAKGRGHSGTAQNSNRDHPTTPPSHMSPRKQEEPNAARRSISAPIVTGMAAIGVKESDVEKKNKQKLYAEELKAQIRDKTLAKQKEKGILSDIHGGENLQQRARPQRSEDPPPPDNKESRWKGEGRANEPSHGRWSPHHDHPRHHHSYSPPDPPNPPRHRYSPPGDRFYPGPSHHYPAAPDPHYPYPPYPPYMYRPEYNTYAPPPWPQPFYPPTLHPPHPYGPNPYYPPSFPGDGYAPRHHSEGEEYKAQDSWKEEPQGNGRQQPGAFITNSKDPKKDKSAYRSQLKQQMEEKKEKEEKEGHARAKVAEVEEYNPWGKGGGGAPMRDERGRLVADLRKMRMVNNEKLLKSSLTSPRGENTAPADKPSLGTEASPSKDNNGPVTGTLIPEEERQQQGLEDYRESLRKQMEERESLKKKEKEAKKLEDMKELERIVSEQQRIADNYKKEQEMARKREADARARNALLKKEVEDKRTTEASKKLGGADENKAHFATDSHDQMSAQSILDKGLGGGQQYRASSPPVPALKRLLHQQKGFSQPPSPPPLQQFPSQPPTIQRDLPTPPPVQRAPSPLPVQRPPSPPVPALRKKLQADHNQGIPSQTENAVPKPQQSTHPEINQPPRPQPKLPETQAPKPQQDSAKLLRELSAIKKHLQSEHAKLAAKMLPIHRTEGAGHPMSLQPSEPGNSLSTLSKFGRVNQNGLAQQPSYLPPTQQPSYHPPTQQPSYHPPTQQQPSYLPPNSSFLQTLDTDQAAAVNTRTLAKGMYQEPTGPLLISESEQFPIVEQVSTNPPTKTHSRRQWEKVEPRQPSALSSASVTTFDLDAIAAQNEERQKRLEAILNAGALRNPQTVLQDFLDRTNKPKLHNPTGNIN